MTNAADFPTSRLACARPVLAMLLCALVAAAAPYARAEPGAAAVRLPEAGSRPPEFEPADELSLPCEPAAACAHCWHWQVVPEGLIYRSYLAGRESRMGSTWFHEAESDSWLWDISLGGRAGLLRYGTHGDQPQGWQLDVEGAGFPRLDMTNEERDLVSSDFRGGFPLTYGAGPWQFKLAYYHLSSHLGDEYMLDHPEYERVNFTRDALVGGVSWFASEHLRLYGEAGWAFHRDGGAEPWEFQLGADLAPAGPTGLWGAPFAAVNAHLRQEVDFGGTLTLQAGWQWRGTDGGRLFRAGAHFLTGKSPQLEFPFADEEQIGFGVWYDF
jgi:hypothetical protein